jgi:hypothetical protein
MSTEDRTETLKHEYDDWLRLFTWAWYATLKIRSGIPSERRAKRMFAQWISDLRRSEGTKNFRYFRVMEKGGSGQNLHFHVLIGGLRDGSRLKHWESQWNELGGDALIGKFDPDKNGILYMLKEMDDDGNLDIDFSLPRREQSAHSAGPRPGSRGRK